MGFALTGYKVTVHSPLLRGLALQMGPVILWPERQIECLKKLCLLTLLAWNLLATECGAKHARYVCEGVWLRVNRINLQCILYGVLHLERCRAWLSWPPTLLSLHIKTLQRHKTMFDSMPASCERHKPTYRGAKAGDGEVGWGRVGAADCPSAGKSQHMIGGGVLRGLVTAKAINLQIRLLVDKALAGN